jgi:hypothetical protein
MYLSKQNLAIICAWWVDGFAGWDASKEVNSFTLKFFGITWNKFVKAGKINSNLLA